MFSKFSLLTIITTLNFDNLTYAIYLTKFLSKDFANFRLGHQITKLTQFVKIAKTI